MSIKTKRLKTTWDNKKPLKLLNFLCVCFVVCHAESVSRKHCYPLIDWDSYGMIN